MILSPAFLLEILFTALLLPFIAYRFLNLYWRRSLTDWLSNISDKYGINSKEINFFHKKLLAIDPKRSVLVFLDEAEGKQEGKLIGLDEIENCELLVHEINDNSRKKDIDRIELQMKLKTNNNTVIFSLYEKSFFAMLNKTKLQLKAVDCYEKLSAIAERNAEQVSMTA